MSSKDMNFVPYVPRGKTRSGKIVNMDQSVATLGVTMDGVRISPLQNPPADFTSSRRLQYDLDSIDQYVDRLFLELAIENTSTTDTATVNCYSLIENIRWIDTNKSEFEVYSYPETGYLIRNMFVDDEEHAVDTNAAYGSGYQSGYKADFSEAVLAASSGTLKFYIELMGPHQQAKFLASSLKGLRLEIYLKVRNVTMSGTDPVSSLQLVTGDIVGRTHKPLPDIVSQIKAENAKNSQQYSYIGYKNIASEPITVAASSEHTIKLTSWLKPSSTMVVLVRPAGVYDNASSNAVDLSNGENLEQIELRRANNRIGGFSYANNGTDGSLHLWSADGFSKSKFLGDANGIGMNVLQFALDPNAVYEHGVVTGCLGYGDSLADGRSDLYLKFTSGATTGSYQVDVYSIEHRVLNVGANNFVAYDMF